MLERGSAPHESSEDDSAAVSFGPGQFIMGTGCDGFYLQGTD